MMACGYSADESQPVFCSTDNYEKHRLRLRGAFAKVWSGLRLVSDGVTPKAPASRKRVLASDRVPGRALITGDPQHCIIKMRRFVSPHSADGRDFQFDYIDAINRLSKPRAPADAAAVRGCWRPLSPAGRDLLRAAVSPPKEKYDAVAGRAPATAREKFRQFMGKPRILQDPVWVEYFGARPPRGTLARVARRAGAALHGALHPHGWGSKKSFRAEIQCLREWYKAGRKSWARRRGIRRGHAAGPWRPSRDSVLKAKLKQHLRVLVSHLKVEALFKWREVADLLHEAGIDMQSGTVPVERLWANFVRYFPDAARGMSRDWWDLLNNLGYMRYNFRHFNHPRLDPWTRGDALIAERIDNMITLARALQRHGQDTSPQLVALFKDVMGDVRDVQAPRPVQHARWGKYMRGQPPGPADRRQPAAAAAAAPVADAPAAGKRGAADSSAAPLRLKQQSVDGGASGAAQAAAAAPIVKGEPVVKLEPPKAEHVPIKMEPAKLEQGVRLKAEEPAGVVETEPREGAVAALATSTPPAHRCRRTQPPRAAIHQSRPEQLQVAAVSEPARSRSPCSPRCAASPDPVFKFQLPDSAASGPSSDSDPAAPVINAVTAAENVQDLQGCLFPADLFAGFQTEAQIYESAQEKLQAMHEDTRTHRDLAVRHDFIMTGSCPTPILKAAGAVCLKQGIHLESFLLCLDANVTWLEHHRTRLGSEFPPENDPAIQLQDGVMDVKAILEDMGEDEKKPKRRARAKQKAASGRARSDPEAAASAESGAPAEPGAAPQAAAPAPAFHDVMESILQQASLDQNSVDEICRKIGAALGREVNAGEKKMVRAASHEMMRQLECEAVICGGSPSSRKSRSCDLSNDLITKSAYAPPDLSTGSAYLAEATLRGIRTCLLKTHRAAMTTDELMNAMVTPWSDGKDQSHCVPRSKLCTYTQAERDDIITATGPVHLRSYSFQFKLFGQLEGAEWVMRPGPQGFFKRVSFSVSPDNNPWDDRVHASMSMGLLQGLHDWMFRGPFKQPCYLHLSGQTQTFLRIVLQAIRDWIKEKEESGVDVSKWFKIKLGFAFSDILRNGSSTMRQVQFLTSLSKVGHDAAQRHCVIPMEFMAGLHRYFRELELHAGFYRYVKSAESTLPAHSRESALSEAFERAPGPPRLDVGLSVDFRIKRDLVMVGKGLGVFSTTDVYRKIRNGYRSVAEAATKMTEAAEVMANDTILVKVDKPAGKNTRGPTKQYYKLNSWEDVSSEGRK
ncbi:unnamed protein product, partial [Prorocentrum cordatum]